jgi:hypothetical protein
LIDQSTAVCLPACLTQKTNAVIQVVESLAIEALVDIIDQIKKASVAPFSCKEHQHFQDERDNIIPVLVGPGQLDTRFTHRGIAQNQTGNRPGDGSLLFRLVFFKIPGDSAGFLFLQIETLTHLTR